MSVHYKFKSSLEYDTVTFDGLHISVGDLKKSIVQQKKLGKATDFDLLITNAQTQDVYEDDNILIPKNTSVTVARVPIPGATNKKVWDRPEPSLMQSTVKAQPFLGHSDGPPTSDALGSSADKLAQAVDLSSIEASEEEKIKAMMAQSTQEYDPSKYVKIRGSNQVGAVPANYCCFKCGQPGHWIKNCPFTQANIEVRKSTGIPRSFMVPVEGPTVPGAMMTPSGVFAVNIMDHEAYKDHQADKQRFTEDHEEPEVTSAAQPEIPADLKCGICKDLLSEAVLVPCCGESFCDECVRTTLLESEEHTCPSCREKNVSPDTLIPNRFLRTAVANFQKETGYSKLKLNGSARPEEGKEEPKREAAEAVPATVVLNILHEDSNLEPVSDDDMKDLGDGFDAKETEPEEEECKDSPGVERKEKVMPEAEASPAALSPRPGSETRVPTPTVDEKPAAGASPRSREKKFPPQRGPPLPSQSVPPLMPQGAISIQQLLAGSPLLLGSQLAMLQQGILAMQRLPMVNQNMPGGHGPGPGGLHHHQPPQLNHYNPLHHGPPRMPYMPPSGPPPQPLSRNIHQGSNQFPPQMPYGSSSHGHSHYSGSSGYGPGPGYGNQYDRNGGGGGFRSEASSAAAAIAQHPLLQHGVVEDPLAAFERMLKEKEERDRVRKMKRRSYSGSVSKSRSRSPAPKMKRSSISRSRERSLTPSNRRQSSRSRSPAKRARSPLRKRRSRSRMASRSRSRSRSPRRRTRSPRRSRSLVRSRSRSPRPFRYERDYPAFRDNAGGFPSEVSGFPPLPGRDDAMLRGMSSMEHFAGAEAYGGRPPTFPGHDFARDKRPRDGGSYEYRRDYTKGYYEDAARFDDYRSREEKHYREGERSKERMYASKEREREDRSRRVERERGQRPRDHKTEHPTDAEVVSRRKRSRTPTEASPVPVSHAKHPHEREGERASYDAAVSPSSRGRAASSEAVDKRQRKESESKAKDAHVVEDLRARDDESVENTEKAKKEKKKKRKKDKRSAEVDDEEEKSRSKKKKEKHRKRSPNLKSGAMDDDRDLETGHSKVNKDPDVTFVNPSPPGPPSLAPDPEELEAMEGGSELSLPSVIPEQRSELAEDSADAFESSMEALEKSNKWRPLQLATPPSHGNGKAEEEVDDVLTLHPKEDDLTIDTDALGRFPAPKPNGEEKRERSPDPEAHRKDSRKHYCKEEKTSSSKASKSKSSGRVKEDHPAASSHASVEAPPYVAVSAADAVKRSDNAIFKRAISAIKPIEIKPLKLFLADREKPKDKEKDKERHRTLSDRETQLKEVRSANKPRVLDRSRFVLDRNPTPPKDSVTSSDLSHSRVSAKERLGEKIDLAGRKPSKERSRSRERKHGSSRKGEEHHSHSQIRHAEDSTGRRVENPGKAETPELAAPLLTEESNNSKGDSQKRESRRSTSVASSSTKRKKSKSKKRKRSASTASSGSNSDSSSEDEKARKKKAKKSKKTKKAKKHKHS